MSISGIAGISGAGAPRPLHPINPIDDAVNLSKIRFGGEDDMGELTLLNLEVPKVTEAF